MSKTSEIIKLAQDDPFMSHKEIAYEVDTTTNYVGTVLHRNGLRLRDMRFELYQSGGISGVKDLSNEYLIKLYIKVQKEFEERGANSGGDCAICGLIEVNCIDMPTCPTNTRGFEYMKEKIF